MAKRKGIGGHQSAKSETTIWLTPRYILDALGPFDLDPCAAPDPILWPTAANHYVAPGQNGLLLPWHGRIWLNPPYDITTGKWLSRLASHSRGTALIFARTETKTFFEQVWNRADAILFLKGRPHFHSPDGTQAEANCGGPIALIAYGEEDTELLIESRLDGAIAPLNRPTMLFMAIERLPPMPAWREAVSNAFRTLGGTATLSDIYKILESHPKTASNPNWRAKIRQTIARMELKQTAPATYQHSLFA
jgi:hypothetical protein